MTDELPAPLVDADVDLTKLDGFMLDTVRLLGSDLMLMSSGDEFKAAVTLWCRAWKQRPACSLPDDERTLAAYAGVPLAKWSKIKEMALRGFVKCSDGRLYHRVLAEDAQRAHKAQKQRRDAIRKRWGKDTGEDTGGIRPYNDTVAPEIPETGQDGTGRDGTKESKKEKKVLQRAYAFEGAVIRLIQRDFDNWSKAYHAIPDLTAELQGIDDKLALDPPPEWFGQVSAWLRKKHERLLASRPRKSKNPTYGTREWADACRKAGMTVDPSEIQH